MSKRYSVSVKPHSKSDEVTASGGALVVRTRAPAREGKANVAVIGLVADYFKVPRSSVRLVSGMRSRNKIVEVG